MSSESAGHSSRRAFVVLELVDSANKQHANRIRISINKNRFILQDSVDFQEVQTQFEPLRVCYTSFK